MNHPCLNNNGVVSIAEYQPDFILFFREKNINFNTPLRYTENKIINGKAISKSVPLHKFLGKKPRILPRTPSQIQRQPELHNINIDHPAAHKCIPPKQMNLKKLGSEFGCGARK